MEIGNEKEVFPLIAPKGLETITARNRWSEKNISGSRTSVI